MKKPKQSARARRRAKQGIPSDSNTLSELEREVVALNVIGSSIDDMVNHSLMLFMGSPDDTQVGFHTAVHQQLFSVLLKDFLEDVAPFLFERPKFMRSQMHLLDRICSSPHFNVDNSIAELREATRHLREWFEAERSISIWMPSIDRQADLRLTREEFVRICGTVAKHNMARLTFIADSLSAILKRSEIAASQFQALEALDDFYERFHDDILNYHSTTLAELLNNIRWGIQGYLTPEFRQSLSQQPGEIEYSYRYPSGIANPFAKSCYWSLMNDIRCGPIVQRFVGRRILKLRY
jgi:hypothetical protein